MFILCKVLAVYFYGHWLIEVEYKLDASEVDLGIFKLFWLIVTDAEFKNSVEQPKYDGSYGKVFLLSNCLNQMVFLLYLQYIRLRCIKYP